MVVERPFAFNEKSSQRQDELDVGLPEDDVCPTILLVRRQRQLRPATLVMPQVMTLTHRRRTRSQAAMAGLDFCFIASTCSFILFFMSFIEGSALWVAIIQL
jgi:hypothetical protein